jgi:KDO2-lipid IV(A) lauroyltransferase
MKTMTPVLPAFIVRQGTGFVVHIGPEIPLHNTGQKQLDIQKNTERYNKVLENIIREYPEQWLWMHKRWKTKPKGTNTYKNGPISQNKIQRFV